MLYNDSPGLYQENSYYIDTLNGTGMIGEEEGPISINRV